MSNGPTVASNVSATLAAKGPKTRHQRRVITGMVVSNKMQKTIVVQVDKRVRHTLYRKYVSKSRCYKAHDETNQAQVGDRVALVESRPLSRDKRWVLQKIVRRANQVPDLTV